MAATRKAASGIQAVAHRQASESGAGPGVDRDRPEQLVERRPSRGHVPGEQLALGRAIALADGQRRHLAPQQQPPTELLEPLRRLAAPLELGRPVVPHQPARLGVDAEEQDQPATLPRRDRARLVLQRQDGRQVESILGQRAVGLGDEVVVGLGVDWPARTGSADASPAARAPSTSIADCQVVGTGARPAHSGRRGGRGPRAPPGPRPARRASPRRPRRSPAGPA